MKGTNSYSESLEIADRLMSCSSMANQRAQWLRAVSSRCQCSMPSSLIDLRHQSVYAVVKHDQLCRGAAASTAVANTTPPPSSLSASLRSGPENCARVYLYHMLALTGRWQASALRQLLPAACQAAQLQQERGMKLFEVPRRRWIALAARVLREGALAELAAAADRLRPANLSSVVLPCHWPADLQQGGA